MNCGLKRKRLYQVEFDKENYQRHLIRLENLKDGKSPQQLHKERDLRKLNETILESRKIHAYSRNYRIKEMKLLESSFKGINYQKVCSVVKNDFDRASPMIAPKHKRSGKAIIQENERMFERIVSVKSEFNFHNQRIERMSKGNTPIKQIDFFKLYSTSRVNKIEQRVLKVKLGKAKKNKKLEFNFKCESEDIFSIVKDQNSLYALEIASNASKVRTGNFIFGELKLIKLMVKVPSKNYCEFPIKVKLIKVLDNKEMAKGQFKISEEDLAKVASGNSCISLIKELKDSKGASEGFFNVKLTLLKKPLDLKGKTIEKSQTVRASHKIGATETV